MEGGVEVAGPLQKITKSCQILDFVLRNCIGGFSIR